MQAGLCLCCLQSPKDRFSRVEVHAHVFQEYHIKDLQEKGETDRKKKDQYLSFLNFVTKYLRGINIKSQVNFHQFKY